MKIYFPFYYYVGINISLEYAVKYWHKKGYNSILCRFIPSLASVYQIVIVATDIRKIYIYRYTVGIVFFLNLIQSRL